MHEERTIRDQLEECASIVDQLIDVVNTARKAFVHQRGQLLVQLNNQQDPLCREIDSKIMNTAELMSGKYGGKREPYLRLHSILTHLKIIAETTCRLEETLQKQIKEGILFSDKAISQVSHILDRHIEILSALADVTRNGGKDLRQRALDDCADLAQSCLRFATDHESRLVEGLCFPQAAPLFLTILDEMQTIVHHEREVARLLGNNF